MSDMQPPATAGGGRPARVLYVIDELATAAAGTERQLLELIGGLDRSRFEPHLAVLRNTVFLTNLDPLPCSTHLLDVARVGSVRGVWGLVGLSRLIRSLQCHLAHVFFNDASIAAPLFCRLGGARVMVSRRDMGFWYTPSNLRALGISNRFVDTIVANSGAVKQNVHEHERFPLGRIAVVGNGHRAERFAVPAAPGLRAELGIAPDAPIVGMVANLYPRKRQGDLIRALATIRRMHAKTHVVLVGSGADAHELANLARALDLGPAVHILQGVTDAVPIVKHFDVAVLCSESEGFSNAVLEYAFCGRPIVCSDVGGNPEIVRHGETGLLVQPADVSGLASAVIALLSEPQRAQVYGESARAIAFGRYTREAMVDAYMTLYEQALTVTPMARRSAPLATADPN